MDLRSPGTLPFINPQSGSSFQNFIYMKPFSSLRKPTNGLSLLLFLKCSDPLTVFFICSFLAALGLCCFAQDFSSCSERGYSLLWCMGFSLQWLLLLQSTSSRRTGFSSCSSNAQELWCTDSVAPRFIESSWDRTCIPFIGRRILIHCATKDSAFHYFLILWLQGSRTSKSFGGTCPQGARRQIGLSHSLPSTHPFLPATSMPPQGRGLWWACSQCWFSVLFSSYCHSRGLRQEGMHVDHGISKRTEDSDMVLK